MNNNPKISKVLKHGGTVVVPSRQRAAAIRLAHIQAQLAAGLSDWPSCDVLPWSAWLERTAALARHGALRGLRRLGATEEWLAWRAAAIEAGENLGMLMPATLADALRDSCARVRDGSLRWPATGSSESALFERASAIMTRYCREQGAVSSDDWLPVLRDMPATATALLFAGFEQMGAALSKRLQELGAVIDPGVGAEAVSADEVVAAADPLDELRRAAQWSRALLERDASARVLIVVPRLAQCRAIATQAFDHELNGAEACQGSAPRTRFAIEGGVPLSDYPLVSVGLALLALSSGALEFPELAALLRCDFLRCGTRAARAALELVLRDRNVSACNLVQLQTLARTAGAAWSEPMAAALEAVLATARRDALRREEAGAWAPLFAAQLELWGWPGAQSLDSAEQQQRERFEALLGEFATLGSAGGRMNASAALGLLRTLAARTAFEPATDDAAVTLSASPGDPLVHYDGIWVTGLNAEQWPAPARADPFIPIDVQRAAQLRVASPAGQLENAQRAMAAWRSRAQTLVFSWPRSDDDVNLQASSLLRLPIGLEQDGTEELPQVRADPLVAALRASARLELRPPEQGLPWPRDRTLPRGTQALDLQAACPFRAAAELRLDAAPLREPLPGLDLRERGRALHRALELVWRQLGGSLALRASGGSALQELARQASGQALGEILARRATPLSPLLLANEQARSTALIAALLEAEQARADFTIEELEVSRAHQLAGVPIRVRMDRVDRLSGDQLIVIDYKSGAPGRFVVDEQRPEQVQLLVYMVLVGAPLAGIAAVHLRSAGIRWRGAAIDPAIFPALSTRRGSAVSWPELLPYAQRIVEGLARDFAAGVATVAPAPNACERCHLAGLCRIESERLALAEPVVEQPGLEDEH
ncbi:MAG: PD-(D/E)XK nuclease family protein [Steroidobacteraceae bacterium]